MTGEYRQLTYEQISAAFWYNPATGELWRRLPDMARKLRMVMKQGGNHGGFQAGKATFRGYQIKVTHIVFLLMTKRWPKPGHFVDHRDGDVSHNQWANLREVTPQQSSMNMRARPRIKPENTGLERGVYPSGKGYQVALSVDGRIVCFGSFANKEKANAVARRIRAVLHGEWSYEASRRGAPAPDLTLLAAASRPLRLPQRPPRRAGATPPWQALGISRATYYRRQRALQVEPCQCPVCQGSICID